MSKKERLLNVTMRMSLNIVGLFHSANKSSSLLVFYRIYVLKKFVKLTGKHGVSFHYKKTPWQLFSCEFCEVLLKVSGRLFP